MLRRLVIPRQSAVKGLWRNDLHCMQHKADGGRHARLKTCGEPMANGCSGTRHSPDIPVRQAVSSRFLHDLGRGRLRRSHWRIAATATLTRQRTVAPCSQTRAVGVPFPLPDMKGPDEDGSSCQAGREASVRRRFHAEDAERCTEQPTTASARGGRGARAQRSLRRTHQSHWDCGWRRAVRRCKQSRLRERAITAYSRTLSRSPRETRSQEQKDRLYFTTSTQSFSFAISAVFPSLSNAMPCGVPPRSRDVTTVNVPRDTTVSVPNDDER